MSSVFPQIFNPAQLGRSFSEHSSEILHTTHHEVVRRWFHSEQDAELFIWTDSKKRILKQQFFCFGQVVEWNAVDGVRTGAVVFDERHPQEGESLHFDLQIQGQSLIQACSVIRQMTALIAPEREQICLNFQSERPSLLGGESGFGPQWMASLVRPGSKSSFFKRLVTRFKAWFKI